MWLYRPDGLVFVSCEWISELRNAREGEGGRTDGQSVWNKQSGKIAGHIVTYHLGQTSIGTHLVSRSTDATENKRFDFGDREILWY